MDPSAAHKSKKSTWGLRPRAHGKQKREARSQSFFPTNPSIPQKAWFAKLAALPVWVGVHSNFLGDWSLAPSPHSREHRATLFAPSRTHHGDEQLVIGRPSAKGGSF